jgi:conjugative transfer signal peptidase TraF
LILRKLLKGTALLIVGLIAGLALLRIFGRDYLALNVTESAPVGLYWRSHDPHAKYATFCLEGRALEDARSHGLIAHGMCPDGNFPLMKIVYRPEQVSSFTSIGFIDAQGQVIDHTAPKPVGFDGKPLVHIPFGKTVAATGTFWALSHNRDGYDSRYFGPISEKQILFYDKPVPFLTF